MNSRVDRLRMWRQVNSTARPIAILGLASLIAGVLVGGVGGRVVMAISARAAGTEVFGRITENGNVVGEFTLAGTLALVVFVGLLGGVGGSIAVVASDPWLRWLGPLQGVGFGVVVLAVFGYATFESVDFIILDPVALNVAMFLGLFIAFGVGVQAAAWVLDRRLPEASDGEQIGWLIVLGLGALPLFVSLLFFTSPEFCGCEPATEIGIAFLVMVASTIVFHLAAASLLVPGWAHRVAAGTGYLSLIAALYFGLSRTIEDLQRLL